MTTTRKIVITGIIILSVFLGWMRISSLRQTGPRWSINNTFHQIRNMAAAYYAQNGSYPYSYGLVKPEFAKDYEAGKFESNIFQTIPYTYCLGIQGNEEFLDHSSEAGYDTDGDEQISVLEYLPLGEKEQSMETYKFSEEIYRPDAITPEVQHEVDMMKMPR